MDKRKIMTERDTVTFRLELLEKDRAEVTRTLGKLAKSQTEMSGDIRMLIKEQMRLTQALRGISSYQYEVRQMHSTVSRMFSRIERMEKRMESVRDEFHVYRAMQDGKTGVFRWMAEHWQFMALIGGIIFYSYWLLEKAING